jgi:hypothetical protein
MTPQHLLPLLAFAQARVRLSASLWMLAPAHALNSSLQQCGNHKFWACMLCRQSRRNLHELLGFDPLTITSPHQAGYGAGSGAPHVMFGYLKHLWATGDRKDALQRHAFCLGFRVHWPCFCPCILTWWL